MEFCVISPTAGLEKYAVLSKWHLVLAHEFWLNGPYRDFYLKRREAGDFIILDNGAYEGPVENVLDYLPSMIRDLTPHVAVLPDFLLQPWKKTWHAAIAFLDRYFDKFNPMTEWLYIPQSLPGDLHGFIESYTEAISDRRITWLGIPRALAYAITDNPLMRVEFARMVKRDHPGIHLHAFGMVNGDVHELPYLKMAGVESIDSSAPVWRGWNGYEIERKADWDFHGTAVDFNAKLKALNATGPFEGLTIDINAIIKHNLEACGVNTNPSKS